MTRRLLTRARDAILQRRYAPATGKPRRTAVLWPREPGGQPQMLTGHASEHRTRSGCLYNRRARLVRRFNLSAFKRKD
mgnify:CR=1 FL=1